MPLAASGSQQMTLRRAPNIWAFVLLGGVLGAVVGVLVGLSGGGSADSRFLHGRGAAAGGPEALLDRKSVV